MGGLVIPGRGGTSGRLLEVGTDQSMLTAAVLGDGSGMGCSSAPLNGREEEGRDLAFADGWPASRTLRPDCVACVGEVGVARAGELSFIPRTRLSSFAQLVEGSIYLARHRYPVSASASSSYAERYMSSVERHAACRTLQICLREQVKLKISFTLLQLLACTSPEPANICPLRTDGTPRARALPDTAVSN